MTEPPGPHQSPPPYASQPYPPYRPGYPPYGYPALPEHPQGTTVLVLGVLALVVGVTAPFAWFLGVRAEREIRESGVAVSNATQIQVGKILGIVGTALMALAVLIIAIELVAAFAVMMSVLRQAG